MNRSKAAAKRTQVVYSEPRRILVKTETRVSKKGVEYTVNKYRDNPNAKPIKTILHPQIPFSVDQDGNVIKAFNGFKQHKHRKK